MQIRSLIITASALLTFGLKSQEMSKVTAIVDSVAKHYNNGTYKNIHGLLTKDFQEKFPADQITIFYGNIVYPAYGKIIKVKYLNHQSGAENYLLLMEKNALKMVLQVNESNKIASMQWQPYQEESELPLKKKDAFQSDNKRSEALDLKVDSIVNDYMLRGSSCGLSIGVYSNGVYRYYNYGETKRDNKILPTQQSLYEIGSISKTFTGLLLAHAVTDKKLKLNDDIKNYLPEKYSNLQFGGKPILVEHLANHTSRIPSLPSDLDKQKNYDELNPYKNYNKVMIFDYLKTLTLDTFPGYKNEYSNLGTALLGLIIENVYHKSYHELLIEKICRPYSLNSTKVVLSKTDLNTKMAGYNETGKATPYWELNDFSAAGAINSNTSDLLQYFVVNMEEKNEALRLSHELTWGDVNYGIGLGWQIVKTRKGNKLYWHNGGTYGFSSFGGFIKEKKCAVVVLNNTGSNVDFIGLGLLKYLQQ